ncbi:MAG: glycosyltransferase family 4 protein [Paenibacillaceae bacterium]
MDRIHRPRIVIVTPGTFTVPSNLSSSVERVVDALSRNMQDEINMIIFSRRSKGFAGYERKGNIIHIRPRSNGSKLYSASVHRSINRLRPHLIQVENRPAQVVRMKHNHPRTPVWLSLHSVTFLESTRGLNRQIRQGLLLSDRIVVNSEFLKEEVTRRYPFCGRKLLVNHLGTNEQLFVSQWSPAIQKERERLKASMGFENKQIVVYAGRLIRLKGVHHVLNVWSQVVEQHPNAILLIIGSAYYGSDRLTPYVRGLHRLGNKFPHNVRFISFTPYNRMPQWFRIADIAVVPSIGQEAFGLVNVEAMASGVPIIAGDAGGIHEIVEHGKNGYLLKLNSIESELQLRLCELLGDASKRRQFGEYGARIVSEKFTWGKVAERQMELYRRYTHIFEHF